MKLRSRLLILALCAICLTVPAVAQETPTENPSPGEEVVVPPEDEVVEDAATEDVPEQERDQQKRDQQKRDRNAGDPCRIANTVKDAWIDRLQSRVQSTVCNSAVWFDHFFGQGESVDSEEFYGYVGVGVLYKTRGEWDDRSRFDANIPLPNLSKRLNLFVGRGDEDDFVSDRNSSVAEPVAPFEQGAGESWLAGFGYSPPGARGQRLNFRLGAKVSSDPYVFGQARWRLNYFPSENRAIRLRETVFYRSNDDGFGSTTAAAFDWFLRKDIMGRASGSITVSQNDRGADWKAFLTAYHDLSGRWGKARGAAYQYFIRGFTKDNVTVPEYGFRVTYRQQMFRPYLFGEAIVGYSWDKDDEDGTVAVPERVGSFNVGFVIELQFGSRWKQRSGD